MPDISFLGALVAGLLSFLSPCILPMVPFYLCYMAGTSVAQLRDADGLPPETHRRLILSSVTFALGVTTVFVLLGMGATAIGQAFRDYMDALRWIAAAVLILFGLHFIGVLRIGLFYREARVEGPSTPSGPMGSYVMGLAFGFGWTPCVGPALAAILMIAGGMGDVTRGGLLLFTYGIAMTSPFIIAAIFARPFLGWVQRNRKYMGHVEKVMGGMLILFGVLIATNTVSLVAQWMLDTFPMFTRFG